MKKRCLSLLICAVLAVSMLAGCSGKSVEEEKESQESVKTEEAGKEPVKKKGVYTVDDMFKALGYDMTSNVKLGDYISIQIDLDKESYQVTDEDVENEFDYYITAYPSYVPTDKKKVAEGDLVRIDYDGRIDGEPFDGGSDEDFVLCVGDGVFLEDFEAGLVGAKVGDELTIKTAFPEDYYGDESIDGKDVEFKVVIHEIVEEEEITKENVTDEFIQKTMEEELGVRSIEELKAYARTSLEESAEESMKSDAKDQILEKLIEICSVTIPDEFLQAQILQYKENLQAEAENEGMEFEEYIALYYGMESWDDSNEEIQQMITSDLERNMVLDAMVKELDLTISDQEIEDTYGFYAMMYGFEDFDTFCEMYGGKASMALGCAEEKVLDIIYESVKLTND